jgi:TPR repeat protein
VNTPVNFCDGAAEAAHLMAELKAMGNLTQHQLANHRLGPDDVKRAEDRAVLANKANGGDLVENLPYVTDYENAERRGDVKKQKELFDKMAPAAQAQAARWDHNFPLAIKLWTPLADAGDVRSQLNLAGMYNFSITGSSAKYTPVPDAKVVEIMKKVFPHWSRVDSPENLPLAFKYSQLAAEKGNIWGQWALGRAYACGFGTEKNLVLAYMWLSLGLAQRGVTTEMTGVSLPMEGSQKDYGLDRDFISARMKPEEIDQAKELLTQCFKSRYKDCD